MALNEIAKHFYEKEIDRLLDSEDRNIVKEKFLDMRSSIDDLYVELAERVRRIDDLETANKCLCHKIEDKDGEIGNLKLARDKYQQDFVKAEKEKLELENELSVKEDLLKIVAERYDNLLLNSLRVTGIDEDINCGEEPLPFSSDEYEECLEEELEDLRERHRQDCITINQLHTTIDILVDRYAKLREMRGL